MKLIYIIKGVSGCGKTTFADELVLSLDLNRYDACVCCADDWMVNDKGEYEFSIEKLGYVHKKCQEKFLNAIEHGVNLIIVNNTSTKYKNFQFYLETGQEKGYTVFVMTLENYHGNKDVHNVPFETRERQAKEIKESLKLI